MGYTRSMRYARHKTGHKYDGAVPKDKRGQSGAHGREEQPLDEDPVKKQCAQEFDVFYQQVVKDEEYLDAKKQWSKGKHAQQLQAQREAKQAGAKRKPEPNSVPKGKSKAAATSKATATAAAEQQSPSSDE